MRPFSWWLSKPVQLRLNQQSGFTARQIFGNREAWSVLDQALGPKPAGCRSKEAPPTVRKYEGVRPVLQRQRQ